MKNIILFIHIPKTAGSTFRGIVRRNFKNSEFFLYTDTDISLENLKSLPQKRKNNLEIIYGHYHYGVHSLIGLKNFQYMAFMRNPIDRVISFYNYVKNNPRHYLFRDCNKYSLKQLIETGEDFLPEDKNNRLELDNFQLRVISSKGRYSKFGECNDEMLKSAKQNIVNDFSFIGLTDYFDNSLFLIENILGWKNLKYFKKNVSKRFISKEVIDNETIKIITKNNELDIELYEFVKTRFLALSNKYKIDQNKYDYQIKDNSFNKSILLFKEIKSRLS